MAQKLDWPMIANLSAAELAEYISGKLWIALVLMFFLAIALAVLIVKFVGKRKRK